MRSIIRTAILIPLLLPLIGCESQPIRAAPDQPPARTNRPVAIINGVAIDRSALEDGLSESAGAEILREFALDRALSVRCEDLGISIGNDELAQERALLGDTLGLADNRSMPAGVLEELRAQRGLGPDRFERLLRRSAMLRALIGNPEPSQAQIDRAYASAFGDRYRVRLFVSQTAKPAHELRADAMDADDSQRPWLFAERCAEASIHPSSPRGGLIESLSPEALGYPSALLGVLSTTPPSTCSGVMSTEAGYVLVLVESRAPALTPSNEQKSEILARLRQNTQRLAMQRLAAEILEQQEIIVMDRALNWAWTNRR